MELLGTLEGILFVVGEEGITLDKLVETLSISEAKVQKLLTQLNKEYESNTRGIKIIFVGNTFKLGTKSKDKEYYKKLVENKKDEVLSNASLEVLAIIAYNEPITRIEINEIRGIESISVLRKLLVKDLIKETGKSSLPGSPTLYGITNFFLDYFGINKVSDLPVLEELNTIEDDTDLFKSIYKEN